jgi:AraC-like DNA-binding protein
MLLNANRFFSAGKLPVSLFYTHSSASLDWHCHDFSEIAIMLDGEADYETDFSSEKISRGDVVIIIPGGNHRYRHEKNVSLMNLLFQFDRLPVPWFEVSNHPGFAALFGIRPDYYRKMRYYPKIHLGDSLISRCQAILMPAWEAQTSGLAGANMEVFGAFLLLTTMLLRAWEANSPDNPREIPGRLAVSMDYMARHFRESLSMVKLARLSCLSVATFTRHFKAATGVTPGNYLLRLRLQEAACQLAGKKPIYEVAQSAGFTDSNYFARVFRKYFNQTPSEYRKYCDHGSDDMTGKSVLSQRLLE